MPLICSQQGGHQAGIIGVGVQPGADGGGAHVDLADQRLGLAHARHILAHHHRPGVELLPERHRHGILELGATHLDHIGKFLAFGGKRLAQPFHFTQQAIQLLAQRQAQGGGIDIVGRLRHVDMVERVEDVVAAFLITQLFQRQVGDHLVGIHVGRSARAALDHIHHEFAVVAAGNDQIASLGNGLSQARLQQAQPGWPGGGFFDISQRVDQARIV